MENVTVDVLIKNKEQDTEGGQSVKEEVDIKSLTDTELWKQLCSYGVNPGPILPSTRTVYENKLQQLMTQCPGAAAGEKSRKVDCERENVGAKVPPAEVVLQNSNFRVSAECACSSDNKEPLDEITERQKKLLSPDSEHSLAKIVAELQEILPEGKMASHRSQGLRKKVGNSSETSKQKKSDKLHIDYGHPDANTVGTSSRRRTLRETPPSLKKCPENKPQKTCEKPAEVLMPMRIKIAVFCVCVFLLFAYVAMETSPFTTFFSRK
ncbi:LEM domain-containing protein 1 [Pseudonaja textilis]|uniref:LEM domain-containing protein 1 n=1 Tax=Pseudonaja textilis TaxID=8673 RepID=UPI000EA8C573|nr:LEM domain-containing protein 1 [Pseudonaja textilis]XP_026571402.1 LEM domain-containing protein 1 [Pseudonaja textilis]XP_026571403.1 LEM domain-containing protein 1 [Pseudonaja textilis]